MTWNHTYPVRCRIIDVTGKFLGAVPIATPEESIPYIGQEGLAEIDDSMPPVSFVRITLDNGHIIFGHECWWEPIV